MDLFTYSEFNARQALLEQMKSQTSTRPEVISLDSFLRSLLSEKRRVDQRRGITVTAQELYG